MPYGLPSVHTTGVLNQSPSDVVAVTRLLIASAMETAVDAADEQAPTP